MKNRIIFPLIVAAALSSCQRSAEDQANAEEDRAAVQAAAEALDAERSRVQAERESLEAEKEALRMQREADLAAKEQELSDLEADLELQGEEARLAAESLAAEKDALALREQELNAVELEQAGTTVIADWTPEEPEIVQEPVADYNLFYDELEPHGDWFETPDYGYVYQPTVVIQNRSWRPYTYGKWVCSNLGWTWRSDEPFGWATFHYGRWTLLSGRGWCWVPGSEWAPSWCAWREGGGHVGWAPLPPETLAYRGRGWGSNVDVELGIASSWFNFVETRFMANPLVSHCFPVSRNASFIRSTRGCTNIQFLQNRIVSGGPSYADIYQRVNKPWPVCHLDLNAVVGLGHGRGVQDLRHGIRRGNQLQLFAPSIDAPWNARLRPNKVADSWKNVQVVRSESGLQQTWSRRLAESRERQKENAERWAQKNRDLKEAREKQLQANREKVEAAQARIRENVARNISLRQQQLKGTQVPPKGPATDIPERRGAGDVASIPSRDRMKGGAVAGDASNRNGTRNTGAADQDRGGSRSSGATASIPDQNGPRAGAGMPNDRDAGRPSLPPGVTRPGAPQRPPVAVVPPVGPTETRAPEKTSSSTEDRLAEIRRKQQEARDKVAQRNEEIRAKFEEARNARSQPKSGDNGSNAAAGAMQERAAQAQQQRAQEAAQKAAQQAQAKAELQEKIRQQQEANRARQEQAKMEIQRKLQEQQEKVRAAQEQAAQAQAERARQQAEQAQQREMANRQAAEQAAREKQAAAQRAAEQRAQQQAEMARRQEEAQRAAQEKAQQQQEQAREAAEQRARQQQENQERIRQAQEQMREKIREQQEKRQNR